jgi:phage recombination protein Bet
VTTAIQTIQSDTIQPFFTAEQERMILTQFMGGASKSEAAVLLEIVKRRRLDPFSRQVYFVKRWDMQKREDVWAIQTSIDGLRSIAERTGKYDGQDEPEYGSDDAGKFCKVRVYRKDWSPTRAAVGVAYESEFIQKKKDGSITSFWARMPRLMLAKCAEALAIRKAFPEDSAGLYIAEEMPEEREALPARQAHVQSAPAPRVEALPPAPPPVEVLSPGIDPPAMDAPPPEVVPDPDDDERAVDQALRDRIAACTSLSQLVLTLGDVKKLPPPLDAEVMDAYRARRDVLKGGK